MDGKRKIRYRGAVDDRFERGVTKPKATRDFLKDALDSLLAGRNIKVPITDVTACPLELAGSTSTETLTDKITYSEHVAPVLQNRCQACHRPDGIGPFELMTYADAKEWSYSIREVITQDLVPPWHADAIHGHFVNDRSLTDAEYGNLNDELLKLRGKGFGIFLTSGKLNS